MEEEKKKVCTGPCGKEYPATLEFFHKKKNGLYGLRSICKTCRNKAENEKAKNKFDDKKTITITIAKDEYDLAIERAKELNLNIYDYIKLGLLKSNSKYIISVDKNLTDNEAYELSKIGTNINQIAHICNRSGNMYTNDIEYLRNMVQRCWILMDKMYNKIDEIYKAAVKLNE